MNKKVQDVEKKAKGSKNPKNHSVITKVILRIVTILLLAAILMGAAYFAWMKFTEVKIEKNHALVENQLSLCQELVTAKYRYSDIITIKKAAGFAKSYSIVKYKGLIRAGIVDFTDISYSISTDGKKVVLTVPKAEVLGNEIISEEVFDEKQSIFVRITTQEVFDEIEQAKAEALEDMKAEGILEEDATYAKKIIEQFMYSAGFEEVIIK